MNNKNGNEHTYYIYIITNTVNGKVYIGQTYDYKKRFKQHRSSSQNLHLYKSMRKYGLENFTFEVLYEGLSKEEADEIEIRLIAEYDSANSNNGYNHRLGGSRGKNSPETREKISKANKGKVISEETRKKLSEANKGREFTPEVIAKRNAALRKYWATHEAYNKGVPMSDEAKQHMREVAKRGEESHRWNNGEAVVQMDIETDEIVAIYPTAMEAKRITGISNANISTVCYGKNGKQSAGGYKWRFAFEYEIPVDGKTIFFREDFYAKPYTYIPKPKKVKEKNKKTKKVRQRNKITGEIIAIFESATKAEEAVGINKRRISDVCRGVKKSAGGYIWEFVDDKENINL